MEGVPAHSGGGPWAVGPVWSLDLWMIAGVSSVDVV